MSNLTTISSLTLTVVGGASLALAIMLWVASSRVGEPRIRWVSAGFFVLAFKSAFIILTIHNWELHHEAIQSFDAIFDLAAVVLVAMPFFVRRPQ